MKGTLAETEKLGTSAVLEPEDGEEVTADEWGAWSVTASATVPKPTPTDTPTPTPTATPTPRPFPSLKKPTGEVTSNGDKATSTYKAPSSSFYYRLMLYWGNAKRMDNYQGHVNLSTDPAPAHLRSAILEKAMAAGTSSG